MTTAINTPGTPGSGNITVATGSRTDRPAGNGPETGAVKEGRPASPPAVRAEVSSANNNPKIAEMREKLARLQTFLDNLPPGIRAAVENSLRAAGNIERLRQEPFIDVVRAYRQVAERLSTTGEELKQAASFRQQLPEGVADRLIKALQSMITSDMVRPGAGEVLQKTGGGPANTTSGQRTATQSQTERSDTAGPGRPISVLGQLQHLSGVNERDIARVMPLVAESFRKLERPDDKRSAEIRSLIEKAMAETRLLPDAVRQPAGQAIPGRGRAESEEAFRQLASIIRQMTGEASADGSSAARGRTGDSLAGVREHLNTEWGKIGERLQELLSGLKNEGRPLTADFAEKFVAEILRRAQRPVSEQPPGGKTQREEQSQGKERQPPPPGRSQGALPPPSAGAGEPAAAGEKQAVARKLLDLLAQQLPVERLARAAVDSQDAARVLARAVQVQGENVEGKISASFTVPLAVDERERLYPAQIRIDSEQAPGQGGKVRDTWLRLNVDTEYLGMVDLVFHLSKDKKLDIKVMFSEQETAAEFNDNDKELRRCLSELPFGQTSINAVQWQGLTGSGRDRG
ncbi:MAG: hypothetical protein N3A57_07560 [Negativicutes bacterium]|nr:hypothetical protein [Negativicutes bacterium]